MPWVFSRLAPKCYNGEVPIQCLLLLVLGDDAGFSVLRLRADVLGAQLFLFDFTVVVIQCQTTGHTYIH